jgi:hypothetical protein
MSDESKIKNTAEAVKGVFDSVPVYQDGLQPAIKEIGVALQTVAKTVNVVLAPISVLVWGYDQIRNFVNTKVSENLKNTPIENIKTPKPNIAGPALEALKYTGHDEKLRELFSNLLATSMDSITSALAYPCFVEIIKQLTSDEARLVKLFCENRPFPIINLRSESNIPGIGGVDLIRYFSTLGEEAKCERIDMVPVYLDNLCRLGIIEIPQTFEYTTTGIYEPLENTLKIKDIINKNETTNKNVIIERKGIRITQLGNVFLSACAIDHDILRKKVVTRK